MPTRSASSPSSGLELAGDQLDRAPAVLVGVVEWRRREPDDIGLSPVASEAAGKQAVEEGATAAARSAQPHRKLCTPRFRITRRQDFDTVPEAGLEQLLEPAGQGHGTRTQRRESRGRKLGERGLQGHHPEQRDGC